MTDLPHISSNKESRLIFKFSLKTKIILMAAVISFAAAYTITNIKNNHQMQVDARKLNNAISEPIEWVETLSIHMGRKIAAHDNYQDLAFIEKLFRDTLRVQGMSSRIVSWSTFSWSNRSNKLVVNALDGIKQTPDDLIERQYSWRARYNPWMIQITKTSRGMLSNTVIIPVAVGVSNSRDEFQGAIVSGINAKELLNKAESAVNSGNAFMLLNRDTFHTDKDKIIIASANTPRVAKDYAKLSSLTERLKDWIDPAGKAPIVIDAGRYRYSQYSLIEGYQLAVLVGFNRFEFWGDVFSLSAKFFIGFLMTWFVFRNIKVS